jgi:predicted acylesterase/phospholipase RssA
LQEPSKAEASREAEKVISLALSGGGFRAAALHLGVLKRLAERRQICLFSAVPSRSILMSA